MSLVRRMRWAVDHAARGLGLLALFERRMRRTPTVLMYHRVLPDDRCAAYPFPSLVMPASMFDRQVAWLAANTDVRPLRAVAGVAGAASRPLVALTFDDGYADNAEVAAPILERHGVRATFFVTTAFVAAERPMWYDRAALALRALSDDAVRAALAATAVPPEVGGADRVGRWVELLKTWAPAQRAAAVDALERAAGGVELGPFRAMTPDDVRRLAAAGHEIGSHSVTHELLPLLDDAALAAELEHSRAQAAAWSGSVIDGFCYPNGSVDERVAAATARAGYAYACTTESPRRAAGPRDPFRLPRIDVTERRVTAPDGAFDLVAFRAEVSTLHEALR